MPIVPSYRCLSIDRRSGADLAHATRVSSLTTLTASIAHELSQPLSGIVTNASTCLRMLSNEPPNVGGASEAARRLLHDGNRASDVITRLRALFSRKARAAEPVDLNDATREVIALSGSDLQRARATLGVELADDLPAVLGDRVQLQQVIINLLRNACDAVHDVTTRPREIEIRTSREEADRVSLSVRDSGVGFGANGSDKLFDAFYSTKPEGMGIGLSVCRSIIENHHGRLWAVSNDGPGVTFTFSIPRGPMDGDEGNASDALAIARAPERRTTREMRDSELGDRDLPSALEAIAKERTAGMRIDVSVNCSGRRRRLERSLEETAFRIGREAIVNAVRHGEPHRIDVRVEFDEAVLRLAVRDDGRGFSADEGVDAHKGHFGLSGMRERAERRSGRCDVSSFPGHGTTVTVELPLTEHSAR